MFLFQKIKNWFLGTLASNHTHTHTCDRNTDLPPNPDGDHERDTKPIKEDLDEPNLYIGKKIGRADCLQAQVLAFDNNSITVQVISLFDTYFQRYLDTGRGYILHRHESDFLGQPPKMIIWEIAPEQMKRDVSQVLLFWEEDIGWTWDLDT